MTKKTFQDTPVAGLYGMDQVEEPQPDSRFGAWLSGLISGVAFTLVVVAIYQGLVTVGVMP